MATLRKMLRVLISFILSGLFNITNPIFYLIYEKNRGRLPPITDPLLLLSAVELAKQIRNRQIKSEKVVQTYINRIKEVNPHINAVIATRFDEALQEARAVDVTLDSGVVPDTMSVDRAPFLGVPFTAKEAFALTGMPNSSGLLVRRNLIAEEDADTVAAMRRAGAIPLGLTNCSELCMWYESSNLLYGRTNNAYHMGRMVGGSSGGEACNISAAGSVFGIGSDIGGSIRMPAFFNGIYGHKPSRGIVSNEGQFPNALNEAQTFLSTGPLCRYASDLIPMLKVLAGPEACSQLQLDKQVSMKDIKVLYAEDDGESLLSSKVHSDIRTAIQTGVQYLTETCGIQAENVSISKLKYSFQIWSAKMSTSDNESFCSLLGNSINPINPLSEFGLWIRGKPRHTLPAIGLGFAEKAVDNPRANKIFCNMCEVLREDLKEKLGDNGVFIYPTHPIPAPYHNQPLLVVPNFAYTGIFNVLGFPVTHVPMGLSREGVPVGFQVIANHNNDRLTLAVANVLDKCNKAGWVEPSKY